MSKISDHPLYSIWRGMKSRCNNPKDYSYKCYGGRGIKVCKRWETFEDFRDDLFSTYMKPLVLDRIDNTGDYTPENCRWVTRKTDSRNNRRNKRYKNLCIAEWAELLKIPDRAFRGRVHLCEGNIKKAIEWYTNKPYKPRGPYKPKISNGPKCDVPTTTDE